MTKKRALELLEKIYEDSIGCCLHIVVDDFNLEDSSVEFCLDCAREEKHCDCEELALILLDMTLWQRVDILGDFHKFDDIQRCLTLTENLDMETDNVI